MVGTQETNGERDEWEFGLQETLGPGHVLFHSVELGTIHLAVFLRRDLIWVCSGKNFMDTHYIFATSFRATLANRNRLTIRLEVLMDALTRFIYSCVQLPNLIRIALERAVPSARKEVSPLVLVFSAHLSSSSIATCRLTLRKWPNVSAISKKYSLRSICPKSCLSAKNTEASCRIIHRESHHHSVNLMDL